MTAYMVIAIPSVRKDPAHDIVLHRMAVDYGEAETVNEKLQVYSRRIDWLLAMYCREIWAAGVHPAIFVEVGSKMNDDDFMEE